MADGVELPPPSGPCWYPGCGEAPMGVVPFQCPRCGIEGIGSLCAPHLHEIGSRAVIPMCEPCALAGKPWVQLDVGAAVWPDERWTVADV